MKIPIIEESIPNKKEDKVTPRISESPSHVVSKKDDEIVSYSNFILALLLLNISKIFDKHLFIKEKYDEINVNYF